MSSQVGTLLNGRYRLDAQIGAGGMSTVYRAFDTLLERQVAIKLMHREIASDSDQLERFRREARAVAQLNHPHVVGVIDAGEEGDPQSDLGLATPYIVFEYVEGETLKDRIRRHGRLPIGEAVAYAIEIARALGAAHDHRIVHRDVKPQNVLIDEEGTAKVTDFGIARSPRRGSRRTAACSARPTTSRPSRPWARTSTRRATSTRWAWCCSRCSPATFPSTARTRSRWR
jgi:serine/threonine-protein kinase